MSETNIRPSAFDADVRKALAAALPSWLPPRRWFGAKTRIIDHVSVAHVVPLPGGVDPAEELALAFITVQYEDETSEQYQLALQSMARSQLSGTEPGPLLITTVEDAGNFIVIAEASHNEKLRQALLTLIEDQATLHGNLCILTASKSHTFDDIRGDAPLSSRTGSTEQSNTNFLFGDTLLLKMFRRIQPGLQPDVEIGRFLTDVAHFHSIPPFLGEIQLSVDDGRSYTIAMLQGLVRNAVDGWAWTQTQLQDFFAAIVATPHITDETVSTLAASYVASAALLGQRTAEMHLALATPTNDQAFAAAEFSSQDREQDHQRLKRQLEVSFNALEKGLPTLPPDTAELARKLLAKRATLSDPPSISTSDAGLRIRIHGDYHLGQIMHTQDDFVILDFEGEPARALEERRQKQSPLRDVAGMLRSFSYASGAGLRNFVSEQAEPDSEKLPQWASAWESIVSAAFLKSYRATASARPDLVPQADADFDTLLEAYLLEKAMYELLYELNNRPSWVDIPLSGIDSLRSVQPGMEASRNTESGTATIWPRH